MTHSTPSASAESIDGGGKQDLRSIYNKRFNSTYVEKFGENPVSIGESKAFFRAFENAFRKFKEAVDKTLLDKSNKTKRFEFSGFAFGFGNGIRDFELWRQASLKLQDFEKSLRQEYKDDKIEISLALKTNDISDVGLKDFIDKILELEFKSDNSIEGDNPLERKYNSTETNLTEFGRMTIIPVLDEDFLDNIKEVNKRKMNEPLYNEILDDDKDILESVTKLVKNFKSKAGQVNLLYSLYGSTSHIDNVAIQDLMIFKVFREVATEVGCTIPGILDFKKEQESSKDKVDEFSFKEGLIKYRSKDQEHLESKDHTELEEIPYRVMTYLQIEDKLKRFAPNSSNNIQVATSIYPPLITRNKTSLEPRDYFWRNAEDIAVKFSNRIGHYFKELRTSLLTNYGYAPSYFAIEMAGQLNAEKLLSPQTYLETAPATSPSNPILDQARKVATYSQGH